MTPLFCSSLDQLSESLRIYQKEANKLGLKVGWSQTVDAVMKVAVWRTRINGVMLGYFIAGLTLSKFFAFI